MAASIKDVAKRAGVSISTVSKYINGLNIREENRERIEEAVNHFGFKANMSARNLKRNKTMTVAVIITKLDFHFCSHLIPGIQNKLLENGYYTVFFDLSDDDKIKADQVKYACEGGVDGVIVFALDLDETILDFLKTITIPVVFIENIFSGIEADVVLIDTMNGMYLAAENLILNGHTRIGVLCGPEGAFCVNERLKGVTRAFEDNWLSPDVSLFIFGRYDMQSGFDGMNKLLSLENRPTAVIATNEELTIGALRAISASKISIPEDISFIGFDIEKIAEVIKPGISYIWQPINLVGEKCAEVVLKRMRSDAEKKERFKLKTDFIKLNSVQEICN